MTTDEPLGMHLRMPKVVHNPYVPPGVALFVPECLPDHLDLKLLMRRTSVDLAIAYACAPRESMLMKPATDFGAMIADGMMLDAARRSWHRRKRKNRTRHNR